MVKLSHVANDCTKAVNEKMTRQAKQMVRENLNATNQLTMLSDQTTQLLRDNERAKRKESQMKSQLGIMESLEHQWAKKLRSKARVWYKPI